MAGMPQHFSIGDIDFIAQADGSVLIARNTLQRLYVRMEEEQAADLFVWLAKHLRIKL